MKLRAPSGTPLGARQFSALQIWGQGRLARHLNANVPIGAKGRSSCREPVSIQMFYFGGRGETLVPNSSLMIAIKSRKIYLPRQVWIAA